MLGAPVIGVPCCQEICAGRGRRRRRRADADERQENETNQQTDTMTGQRSCVDAVLECERGRTSHLLLRRHRHLRESLLEGGDPRVHTTLHGPAGDPLHLRDLPGRTLAEVRQLENRALTLMGAAPSLPSLAGRDPDLRAPLGSRLVGRFREPRQGGSFRPSKDRLRRRSIARLRALSRIHASSEPRTGIEGRTGAHDLEEGVLDQVFGIGLAAQEDQTQAVDAGCEPIVESACRISLIAQECLHQVRIGCSRPSVRSRGRAVGPSQLTHDRRFHSRCLPVRRCGWDRHRSYGSGRRPQSMKTAR